MSIEQIRSDLALNLEELRRTPATPEGLLGHLENTLYPFLSSFVDDMAEIDEAVEELAAGDSDALTPFTAETLLNAFTTMRGTIILLLKKAPALANDPKVAEAVAAAEQLCTQAKTIIESITLPDDDDEGEAEGDDKEGAEDDDDGK